MDFEETLQLSRSDVGPVGAAIFVAKQIVRASDVGADTVEMFEGAITRAMSQLSEDERLLLGWVLDQRVSEAHGMGSYSGLVRLAGRLTTVEAHILHDALVGAGLDTRIRREHVSAADVLHPSDGVEVWVHPSHIMRARDLMASLRDASEQMVACSGCGENSPGHFGLCWNCGNSIGE